MNGISKETFLKAENALNRDAMLYDMLVTINDRLPSKWATNFFSLAGGIMGGFVAVMAYLLGIHL
jgi:hypothetical protein